jgi:2-C-methyl-D-erythritol 4-phosphate cytidylyltransferase
VKWGAVIAAGGTGERFGRPKQFVKIAGIPMIGWSIRTFSAMSEIAEIVVAIDPSLVATTEALLGELVQSARWRVVAGGMTRQESVRRAIAALGEECEAALVHDGARPLVRAQSVRAGMREVRMGRGAVLAAPVVDTIKIVHRDSLRVERTLERAALWAAQTPQFAMLPDFRRAYESQEAATDDTSLLERIGVEVVVVPTAHANFKITVPDDVPAAEVLLRARLDSQVPEPETVLVEVFSPLALVDTVCRQVESLGGRIDAIERELPRGAAVRAYIRAERLREFESSFVPFADGSATLTVHDVGGVV